MDSAATPRVLVVGLDPHRVPGDRDPEPVVKAIDAGMAKFAEHGVAVESCAFGLDGSDDIAVNSGPGPTYEAAARWID